MSYRDPTRYCAVDDGRIQEKAADLERPTDTETAQAVFSFVRDAVDYNIQRKMHGAAATLEHREGMCFDKTSLFIALCRASGIDARYREMHCTLDAADDLPEDAFHMVPEIRLDGDWVTQDPSFGPELDPIITVSEWGRQTWTSVQRQRRYAELPIYLPPLVNHVLVPFSPRLRRVQTAIDAVREGHHGENRA